MVKIMVLWFSDRVSSVLELIAAAAIVLVMLLTGADVVGRALGHPIPGTYEIVSFAGALVIGLAIPITSKMRGHVLVDLVTSHASKGMVTILHVITRLMVIAIFLVIGYGIVKMGFRLRNSGEYTAVLSIPFYPVAWATACACFIECVVLVGDILKGGGDTDE